MGWGRGRESIYIYSDPPHYIFILYICRDTKFLSRYYISVLILYICPHTTYSSSRHTPTFCCAYAMYVSSCHICLISHYICVRRLYVSTYGGARHTRTFCCAHAIYVTSCYICLLIPCMRPHTLYVSSYCYICVDLQPYPTHSNFVLCEVVDTDAKGLVDYLRKRGAYARVC